MCAFASFLFSPFPYLIPITSFLTLSFPCYRFLLLFFNHFSWYPLSAPFLPIQWFLFFILIFSPPQPSFSLNFYPFFSVIFLPCLSLKPNSSSLPFFPLSLLFFTYIYKIILFYFSPSFCLSPSIQFLNFLPLSSLLPSHDQSPGSHLSASLYWDMVMLGPNQRPGCRTFMYRRSYYRWEISTFSYILLLLWPKNMFYVMSHYYLTFCFTFLNSRTFQT